LSEKFQPVSLRNAHVVAPRAGLARIREFQKPVERAFTAPERDSVTILCGGLTWKHEMMIKAVFRGSGSQCENIPTLVLADFQAGKEYGNNSQCNPTDFTVGKNSFQFLPEVRGPIIDAGVNSEVFDDPTATLLTTRKPDHIISSGLRKLRHNRAQRSWRFGSGIL
jgi:hypothetical protein